eukprot:Awhi_evm1s7848
MTLDIPIFPICQRKTSSTLPSNASNPWAFLLQMNQKLSNRMNLFQKFKVSFTIQPYDWDPELLSQSVSAMYKNIRSFPESDDTGGDIGQSGSEDKHNEL